jgi:hypothetical protein
METDVFRRLEELQISPTRWSTEDVDRAINEGLEELSDISEFYERYATIKLRQYAVYYDLRAVVPDTILRVTSIYNPTNNLWLRPTDVWELDYKTARQWEIVYGEPQKWQLRGLWWMGLYPATSTTNSILRVYYRSLHPTLTDVTQSPQQLPEDYHTNLVDYAMYTLLADDMEESSSLRYWQRFNAAAQALKQQCSSGGRAARARVPRMGGPRI